MSYSVNKRFKPNPTLESSMNFQEQKRHKRTLDEDTNSGSKRFQDSQGNWQARNHQPQLMLKNQQNFINNRNEFENLLEEW